MARRVKHDVDCGGQASDTGNGGERGEARARTAASAQAGGDRSNATTASSAASDEASFEELLGQLDSIVRRIESGELGLDGSINAFESGVALVKRLQARLTAAEARVRWLVAEVESEGGVDSEDDEDARD